MKRELKKLLFIRLDRIGDLVLTLPVDESFPEAQVQWWIPPNLSFVTENATPRRQARELKAQISRAEFLKLLRHVRAEKFDAVLVFNGPWWVSFLLWLARIPVRAGVKSKWHSFLFLNRAIRQKRSESNCNELEYNYRLAEAGLGFAIGTLVRNTLKLNTKTRSAANSEAYSRENSGPVSGDGSELLSNFASEPNSVLQKHGLATKHYSVVHPGMGGSALNWPIHHYASMVEELAKTDPVVITGTKSDEPYLSPLKDHLSKMNLAPDRVRWLDQKLSGPELLTILGHAKSVTAPSTGVLHLAASTGTHTLGIFSPVQVQRPKRWGPQGRSVATLMPDVNCPGKFQCLGPSCPMFNCMETITAPQALAALAQLSENHTPSHSDFESTPR